MCPKKKYNLRKEETASKKKYATIKILDTVENDLQNLKDALKAKHNLIEDRPQRRETRQVFAILELMRTQIKKTQKKIQNFYKE